jgi:hypothetical protein
MNAAVAAGISGACARSISAFSDGSAAPARHARGSTATSPKARRRLERGTQRAGPKGLPPTPGYLALRAPGAQGCGVRPRPQRCRRRQRSCAQDHLRGTPGGARFGATGADHAARQRLRPCQPAQHVGSGPGGSGSEPQVAGGSKFPAASRGASRNPRLSPRGQEIHIAGQTRISMPQSKPGAAEARTSDKFVFTC